MNPPPLLPALRVAIAFAACAGAALAQPLDLAFAPAASADVFAVAAQADGKVLVGGNFTALGTTARSRIGRINPDGTVDAGFNPGASTTVQAILVQPDGRILVGGGFSTLAGAARIRLARLHPDGTGDSAFVAGADASVFTFALQPDGKILIGGLFTQINNTPRQFLARLHPDGSLDSTFEPAISGLPSTQNRVDAIAVQRDGRILIGGTFSQVSGITRANLARLHANGSLDATFAIGTGPNSGVHAVALLPDERILIGGTFTTFSGQPRRNLARLSPAGVPDTVGLVGADSVIRRILVEPDGRFYVAGSFASIGTLPHSHLARFNADGSHDSTFNPQISGSMGLSTPGIYGLTSPAPGLLVLGGTFGAVSGQVRAGLARLGSPLPAITQQPSGVYADAGANVTLTVGASGENLRYQWRLQGATLPGATTATLALPSLQAGQAGVYVAAVTNAFGTTFSAPATVVVGAPPPPTFTFSTLAGSANASGRTDGAGVEARFDHPTGLAFDAAGHLWTVDAISNLIRRISPTGAVTTFGSQAGQALAFDAAGQLHVADGRSLIVRLSPGGVATRVAGADTPGSADGPAATARFNGPAGLAIDRFGEIYVADTGNRTVRRIAAGGEVTTVAGSPGQSGTIDGRGAAARFAAPRGLAFDIQGHLLVADGPALRRLTRDGVVSTVARGTNLVGVAVDSAGHIFLADVATHTIRRLGTDGSDTLVAGLSGSAGTADGAGPEARFNGPWGLALDAAGHLLVADNGNSTIRRGARDPLPFALTLAPAATHAEAGDRATLGVGVLGSGLVYQWKKDGVVLPGATGATLLVTGASAETHMGSYTVVAGNGGATIESAPALLTVSHPSDPGRLVNVATRGYVGPGEALTPGFVLRGEGGKDVLVRAVGPTLLRFGLGGSLPDPRLELSPLGAAPFAANDNWPDNDAALVRATGAVGAFPLDPQGRDAALLAALSTATARAYTVQVRGATAAESGVALAEVYDASPPGAPVRLANVSTRGFVGTGANALVPGFVIGGRGPLHLLIRAVGPGLAPFGVDGVLVDPQLVVTALGQASPLAANDNWGGSSALAAAFAASGAFPLEAGSKDAALLLRLPPGAYTVTVSGTGGTTGAALVEIYDVP